MPWYIFLFVGAYDYGFFAYSLIATQTAASVGAMYCATSSSTTTDSTTACGYALDNLRNLPNVGSGLTTCGSSSVTATAPIAVSASSVTGPDLNPAASVTVIYLTPKTHSHTGLISRSAHHHPHGEDAGSELRLQMRGNGRSGNTLIEFTLVGIPIIFVTMSIIGAGLDMWEYHCLAYSTEATARYASVHGATCSQNSNSCTITIGNMATFYASHAMALDASKVIVKFTDGSGTTTCNPVNSCNSSATQFPNASHNSIGSDVTVSATYILKDPLAMYWPPNKDAASDFTVGATSRQRILF